MAALAGFTFNLITDSARILKGAEAPVGLPTFIISQYNTLAVNPAAVIGFSVTENTVKLVFCLICCRNGLSLRSYRHCISPCGDMAYTAARVFLIIFIKFAGPHAGPVGPDEATGKSSIPVSLAVLAGYGLVGEIVIDALYRSEQFVVKRLRHFINCCFMALPAGF